MIWRVFAKATVAFIKNLKGMAALLFVEQGIHFLIWDWTRGTSNWTRMWNVYKKLLKAYLVMNISVYGFLYIMVQILNFHWYCYQGWIQFSVIRMKQYFQSDCCSPLPKQKNTVLLANEIYWQISTFLLRKKHI